MEIVVSPVQIIGGCIRLNQFWRIPIINYCMIACAMDRNVDCKETEKIEKYLDLSVELQSLWNTKVLVVPLVFGALGS